eukprot:347701-Pyramimonas_sp.AAC.1
MGNPSENQNRESESRMSMCQSNVNVECQCVKTVAYFYYEAYRAVRTRLLKCTRRVIAGGPSMAPMNSFALRPPPVRLFVAHPPRARSQCLFTCRAISTVATAGQGASIEDCDALIVGSGP